MFSYFSLLTLTFSVLATGLCDGTHAFLKSLNSELHGTAELRNALTLEYLVVVC